MNFFMVFWRKKRISFLRIKLGIITLNWKDLFHYSGPYPCFKFLKEMRSNTCSKIELHGGLLACMTCQNAIFTVKAEGNPSNLSMQYYLACFHAMQNFFMCKLTSMGSFPEVSFNLAPPPLEHFSYFRRRKIHEDDFLLGFFFFFFFWRMFVDG